MAIIYTYPIKTEPADDDKILISDSEDDNKTKSVTIEDIRSATVSGVSSIIAGDGISLPSGSTGDVEIDATAYTAGDGIDITAYAVSADIKANSGITIDGTEISLDLSASNISGTLTVGDGGTGATTLTGVLVGNGTSAIAGGGDIDDLTSAQYSTGANGSMYFGNIPSGLSGSPTANSIIGNGTGGSLTTGASNTIIGNRTGDTLTTGGFNTIVGAGADSSAASNRSSVVIGASATAGDGAIAIGREANAPDNKIALGSTNYSLETSPTAGGVLTYLIIVVNGTTYHLPLHDHNP